MSGKPISEIILPTIPKLDSSLFLFLESLFLFLVFWRLLIILGLVALSNLIKQSYSWYFVYNLQAYEMEIKKELREAEDSQVFNFNLGKGETRFGETRFIVASYHLAFRTFVLSFTAFITFIPFAILCYSSVFYAALYLAISLIGFTVYLQIFTRVLKQYSSHKFLL
ncbi:hypothetical protein [Leptothermofonsia sp. ETS-13]|uniref:hypothetical protein n=1 Tax=Leptothermofonsia sp. ETS-13 TaxID=3035696 RepID=UPI003BA1D65F